MVERALQAEHDQVGRHYVDKPFWYSDLDHGERIRAHDGMRAALEAVADEIAALAWVEGRDDGLDDLGATQVQIDYGEVTNPYISKFEWKEN